jgi:hypothetical protein
MEFTVISTAGLSVAAALALRAWTAARTQVERAQWALLFAYCALLAGPASQIYRRVDAWQNLASIARAIERDAAGKPLILFAPDETTRAMIDMYARTQVGLIQGPIDAAAVDRLKADVQTAPQSLIVVQLPAHSRTVAQRLVRSFGMERRGSELPPDEEPQFAWAAAARLRLAKSYSLPNGRRYALFASPPAGAALSGESQRAEQLTVQRIVFGDLARP